MYSKENSTALQELTAKLLKEQSLSAITKKEVEPLREVLRFHEHRYYILNPYYLRLTHAKSG
jgi:DNA ligase (NAD+)